MKVSSYLIVDSHGGMRLKKSANGLAPGEIAVQINLNIPSAPKVAAVVEVDLPAPPEEIDVDIEVGEWDTSFADMKRELAEELA